MLNACAQLDFLSRFVLMFGFLYAEALPESAPDNNVRPEGRAYGTLGMHTCDTLVVPVASLALGRVWECVEPTFSPPNNLK